MMTESSIRKKLADALVETADDNIKENRSSAESMTAIANDIADAIENGMTINVKGSCTVAELNGLRDMDTGDMWTLKDSGSVVNPDGTFLSVTAGDVVRFDGSAWSIFLHLNLDGYVTVETFTSAMASVNATIQSHVGDKSNPHNVTADQVGAYTKDEANSLYETKTDAKTKAENYGIMMRENGKNTLQFYRPISG